MVTVVPRATVAAEGRVLGPGGEPVGGARVRLSDRESKEKRPGQVVRRRDPSRSGGPIKFAGNAEVLTGPDGSFRTPKELDREVREYQAEFFAEGTARQDVVGLRGRRRRCQAARDQAPPFAGDSGNHRSGRRPRRPCGGRARVFQSGDGPRPSDATTDAAGQFRLAGVYEGRALIFADRAGFRLGGTVLPAGTTSVELRLAREGEKPAAVLKTLPSPLGRPEERALGRELLAPVLAEARRGTIGPIAQSVMPALARLDPERVLTMLEERVIGQPRLVLAQVALGQFEDDPRAAIATIESDLDPGSRSWGFLALAGSVPPSEPARRGELLARAFAEARQATSSDARIPLFGEIADRWLAFGEKERASAVLREGKAVIDGFRERNEFYMTDKFAEVLAAIDLPAAQAIFEGKGTTHTSPPDDQNVRRHVGEAAVRVAATNPVEAERLLAHAYAGENVGDHEDLIFRIAINMARADLPRAGGSSRQPPTSPTIPRTTGPRSCPTGSA